MPTKNSVVRYVAVDDNKCCLCRKPGALHFVEEWDDFIHARCVPDYLHTDDGRCIIEHGHDVYLDFSLEKTGEED